MMKKSSLSPKNKKKKVQFTLPEKRQAIHMSLNKNVSQTNNRVIDLIFENDQCVQNYMREKTIAETLDEIEAEFLNLNCK
jgi:hypothetical protein